jgi:hypothetical protein
MKDINNKFATIQINGSDKVFTVADLLKEAVNVIPKDGLTPDLIQKRLRVLQVVNAAKDQNFTTLSFEDADFKTACECVAAMRWGVIDPFIIEFCELFK